MYDRLFSNQWIFDRCVEGSHFQTVIIGLISFVILFLILTLFKKLNYSNIKTIILLFVSSLIIFPLLFFVVQIVGFFIIRCSDGYFWKGVIPANELYTKVKYECSKNNCPKSEKELSNLDPILYKEITANAKSKYSYNAVTKKYLWYVRPSKYYLVSFEGNGFGIFKISEPFGIQHWYLPDFKESETKLPN